MNSNKGWSNLGEWALLSFLWCILVTSTLVLSQTAKPDTYFPVMVQMSRLCGRHVKVNRAMKIGLLTKPKVSPCTIYISPETGNRVMATFVNYDFRKSYKRCEEHVQVCVYSQCFFEEKGYCESTRPTDVYDLDLKGSLTFESDSSVFNTMTFTVLFTEVHIMKQTAQSGCNSYSLFDCNVSGTCIDKSLVCNHYDDCVNGKDESEQCWAITIQTLLFVSFLIFVPGMAVSGVYYYVNKKHRSKRSINYEDTMGMKHEMLALSTSKETFKGIIEEESIFSDQGESSNADTSMAFDTSSINDAKDITVSSGDSSKMSALEAKVGFESPRTTPENNV